MIELTEEQLDILFPNKIQKDIVIKIFDGLIKIKPKAEIMKLFEHYGADGSVIRLETWPEGLVLWVNGKIKYKRWEDTDK